MPLREFSDDFVRHLREEAALGDTATQLAAAHGLTSSWVQAVLTGECRAEAGGPLRPRRRRLAQTASPEQRAEETKRRLLDRVRLDPATGCWLVQGALSRGYATLSVLGNVQAHRASWELFVGRIPDGLVVDHVCHNRDDSCSGGPTCRHRACANPAHLRLTTPADNSSAGRAGAFWRQKMACPHGHPYDAVNTAWYQRRDGGWFRRCRSCQRAASASARKASTLALRRPVEVGQAGDC